MSCDNRLEDNTMSRHPSTGRRPRCRLKKTEASQERFLQCLMEIGVIHKAAMAAGIAEGSHYYWLKHDSTYPERFEAANLERTARLEMEAINRAVTGQRRYLFHRGEPVMWDNPETGKREHYYEVVHSDRLLMLMLQRLMPDKYGGGASGRRTRQRPTEGTCEASQLISSLLDSATGT